MPLRVATLVCSALAAAGVAASGYGTVRIQRAQTELVELRQTSEVEARAFAETLGGAHAVKQLDALLRRRGLARSLAAARRDRLLGILLIVGSGVAAFGLRAMGRIASEIEEDKRHLETSGPLS
jgi:hypothetical protein